MKRILCLLLALTLLLVPLTGAAAESADCTVALSDKPGKEYRLTDGYLESYVPLARTQSVSVSFSGERQGLYLAWYLTPSAYQVEQFDAAGALLSAEAGQTYVNCYYPLLAETRSVRVRAVSACTLSELSLLAADAPLSDVQRWEAPAAEADLVLIAAASESAAAYYALLAQYTLEHGIATALAVLSPGSRTAQEELLSALWSLGIRQYPVFGKFSSVNNDAYYVTRTAWKLQATDDFIADVVQTRKPLVVVTHSDAVGKGLAAERLTAERTLEFLQKGARTSRYVNRYGRYDTPKLYFAETDGATQLSFDAPLAAFSGLSASEAAEHAFLQHATGRQFVKTCPTAASFRLARTTLGDDAARTDLFEHIATGSLRAYLDPTPPPTATPAPTSVPTPAPAETPVPAESGDPAVTVIGGADGPTAVFVADKASPALWLLPAAGLALAALFFLLLKEKPKRLRLLLALLPLLVSLLAFFVARAVIAPASAPAQTASAAPEDGTPAPSAAVSAAPSASPTAAPAPTSEPEPYFRRADDPEEYVLVDNDAGHYEYRSDTLSILIQRYSVAEPLAVYYVAEIRMRGYDAFRSGQAAINRNGSGAILPWRMARENKAVLLVTGDNLINDDTEYKGILIRGGKLFGDFGAADTMAFYPDMTMRIFSPGETAGNELLADGVRNAFSFGPSLIRDGVIDSDVNNHRLKGVNPRTGVGMVEPGHFVAIVVDGRQPGYSLGMTLEDFAALFQSYGCTQAYNLDGGLSTCMLFLGEQLNRHSDIREGESYSTISYQRKVPDGLIWGYSELVPKLSDPVANPGSNPGDENIPGKTGE